MQEGLECEVEVSSRKEAEALVCMQAVQHPAIFRPRNFCEASAGGDQVLRKFHPHRHCHCFSDQKKQKPDGKLVQRETLEVATTHMLRQRDHCDSKRRSDNVGDPTTVVAF